MPYLPLLITIVVVLKVVVVVVVYLGYDALLVICFFLFFEIGS